MAYYCKNESDRLRGDDAPEVVRIANSIACLLGEPHLPNNIEEHGMAPHSLALNDVL